jgi:membrane protein
MKINGKKWWLIFKTTGHNFFNDKPFIYSSSIAYFAIFSLPAIAIITVMIAGSFYEDESVRNQILAQITQLAGQDSAREVERLMDKVSRAPKGNLTKMISILTLFFSATTVFVTLQESINSIWKIKPKPKKGIIKFLMNRLLSLIMICSLGFLVLISLVADTFITLFKDLINQYLSGMEYHLILLINIIVSNGLIAVVFALIYMLLPDAKIQWRYVWVGALITTILFVLGKYLIGLYLSNSDFTESYGAAGSLVALLAWVYYSVLILLFGAEFTYAYTKHLGGKIRPSTHAVAIKEEEIAGEETSVIQEDSGKAL